MRGNIKMFSRRALLRSIVLPSARRREAPLEIVSTAAIIYLIGVAGVSTVIILDIFY